MTAEQLKRALTDYAAELGFNACGIAAADALDAELECHRQWLAGDYQAGMDYLARAPERRYDPRALLPQCQSVVVLAQGIYTEAEDWPRPGVAKVARYAWGDDYHTVIGEKLKRLGAWLDERVAEHRWKATVDTSPLSEKALAVAAGLGWRGGHSLVLNAQLGSWFMLGCLLTSAPLPPDAAAAEQCGSCRRCLEACPTGALVEFGVLDARRCISHATTSNSGAPADVPALSGWLYGCDACQQACPYNAAPRGTREARCQPRPGVLDLTPAEVREMTEEEFRRRFQGTVIHGRGLAKLQAAARILESELQ
jgi:epoxyqueuosine reductase